MQRWGWDTFTMVLIVLVLFALVGLLQWCSVESCIESGGRPVRSMVGIPTGECVDGR